MLLAAVFSVLVCEGRASTLLYSEDFSGQDGQGAVGGPSGPTIDTSLVDWTIEDTSSKNFASLKTNNADETFSVIAGRFEARETGPRLRWISPTIDTRGFRNLELAIDFSEAGSLQNNDNIRVWYSVDGDPSFTLIPNFNGAGNGNNTFRNDFPDTTLTESLIAGDSLRLRVDFRVRGNGQRQFMDNIKVVGSVPVPASGALMAGAVGLFLCCRRRPMRRR
ncbi:MAG: hypothetical protein AAF862_10685 [Pseudomonadota bacterium]